MATFKPQTYTDQPPPFSVAGVDLVRHLGSGAKGGVWEVKSDRFGRCAMKWSEVEPWKEIVYEAKALKEIGPNPYIMRHLDDGTLWHQGKEYGWMLVGMHRGDLKTWITKVLGLAPFDPAKDKWFVDAQISPDQFLRLVWLHSFACFEQMQAKGYIHRDVKLLNMGMDWDEKAQQPIIVMADFGMAKRITLDNGDLMPVKDRKFKPYTTKIYASVATEKGQPQYYVDDLWTLLFSFLQITHFELNSRILQYNDNAARTKEKELWLRDPEAYRQFHIARARRAYFIQQLKTCVSEGNVTITNWLLDWACENPQVFDPLFAKPQLESQALSHSPEFAVLAVAWIAKLTRVSLESAARELLVTAPDSLDESIRDALKDAGGLLSSVKRKQSPE